MSDINLTTLPSGLRIVSDYVPSVESVAIGTWFNVGSRHEASAHNGVAHMVEHMLFKGTKTRDAQKIVQEIEEAGGNMNAYTSREITSYHIHLMKEHTPLALEILSDMVQHSTLPEEEIERERHVILQEIGMTHDTPDDLIFDHYYETAYTGHALGAPILGTAKIISDMQQNTLRTHITNHYTPKNTVIIAAGNIKHDDLVKQVEKRFNALPDDQNKKATPAKYTGGEKRSIKDLEQTHIIMGFEGLSRAEPNYYAAQILANILGGGMSSRLFQEVREKRGLAYSVFAFHTGYNDSGQLGIYAGTGPTDVGKLMPVLCEEINKIGTDITEQELQRAKTQLKSGLLMSLESMMTRADTQARYVIHRGHLFNQEDIIKEIDTITTDTLHKTAQQIFAAKPTLCGLGPLSQLDPYEQLCEKLAA